jgi:peptidoglycan/xylan/chitin deacetylase (PgdA/CDA1 family)
MRRALASPARLVLGHPLATRTALTAAAARGRGLVLLFHRVSKDAEPPSTVLVPTVSRDVLREQIELLIRIGTVVPLASFLDDRPIGRTPRFALTFDDDSISHHEVVLPLLVELGVTATFFLSGRVLHGFSPPWFEILDALIREQGPGAAALKLGLSTSDVDEIAWSCENDRRLQLIVEQDPPPLRAGLGASEIADLRDAGMAVGFHTLHHRALPGLSDAEVDDALQEGREALEAIVAAPLRMFAYPHGKADGRVAPRVRLAGYAGAWTGRPRPIAPGDDLHLLGRWEPGPAVGRDFGAKIAARANGWGGR